MNKVIKRTAKKIFTTGKKMFEITYLSSNAISFRNGLQIFSFQIMPGRPHNIGLFRAGYCYTSTVTMPTFESEYNSLGPVEVAQFVPFHESETNNPDFIIRNALYFIFN